MAYNALHRGKNVHVAGRRVQQVNIQTNCVNVLYQYYLFITVITAAKNNTSNRSSI